ncbi:MAG TPA: transglycosylase domain-containing protein [Nocardioides sp.]|nr:transglycosylase domain-containing protein [Nocardioides sp.]
MSRRDRAKKVGKWLLVVGLVCALLGVSAFVVAYTVTDVPNPNEDFQTQTSFVYYDDGKTELGRYATQNRESISLDTMPQSIRDAVVAAENKTFWTDRGIDPKGILRAAFSNAQGNATQGASTITQQYVKILYLTQEQTLERKLKEAILSLKLHRQLSKTQILEGYLNTIYFGRGAYGVQAAANAYFDVDAKDLDLRQSAVLATVLNNPSRYDPAGGKQARADLKARYDYVLSSMADTGAISAGQADRAQRRLPKFPRIEQESQFGGQRGHVLEMVHDELVRLGFSDEEIDGGGLRVTTTFTQKDMNAAEQGVLEAKPEGFGDKQLHIGVASVEPGTGAVRGIYGGQDYLDSQINWAVAGGQAGSTMKPSALVAAIRDGFSLKDTFDGNSPITLDDGTDFENQGDEDYGSAISMITATENSVNTAFIDMTDSMDNGPQKVLKAAEDLGIPPAKPTSRKAPGFPNSSPGLEPTAGVALGSATVSPINMANAYATLANKGRAAEPYIIEKVVDRNGETRYTHKVKDDRTVDADITADVTYALQQVVQHGSGTAALALGRPVAGKTGTATNGNGEVSSAWFTGYTPQLSTSVMYVRGKGNEQLQGWLPSYFGGDYPAETWTAVMQRAMEGLPIEEFPPPAYVDGDAPETGHVPYTPPPTTTFSPPPPQPSQKPTKRPPPPPPSSSSAPPPPPTSSSAPPPPPTTTTEPAPTPTCTPPDCPNGNGNGQQPVQNNRTADTQAVRERYA